MRNDPRGHSKYRRIAKSVVGKGKPCYWGYPGCTGIATQADHLIPVSKDPSRAKDRSVMVPSCAHCNQSKGNRATPRVQRDVAWTASRSVFSTQRNHIPVLRHVYTHNDGRLTLAPDYTRRTGDVGR